MKALKERNSDNENNSIVSSPALKINSIQVVLSTPTTTESNPLSLSTTESMSNEFPVYLETKSDETPAETCPLSERIVSKTWSTRRDAYTALKTLFSSSTFSTEDVDLVKGNYKNILSDSHNGAQTYGVEMLENWVNCLDSNFMNKELTAEFTYLGII